MEVKKRREGKNPPQPGPTREAREERSSPGSSHCGHQELWQLFFVSYCVLVVSWHFPSAPGADSCKSGLGA